MGLAYRGESVPAMLEFLALLSKWNKVYNLTAICDPKTMLSYHLLDSLSVLPYVQGQTVLDVGTGPGLPGIPLALQCPDKTFVLIDRNGKKTRFARQAVIELGLANVEVVQERVETYRPCRLFDTLVTRAYSALSGILSTSLHLLAQRGSLLAMSGKLTEAALVNSEFQVDRISVQVPGVDAERNILVLTRESEIAKA